VTDPQELDRFLSELIPRLGEVAREGFRDPGPVRYKSPGQPVTETDARIEAMAREAILSTWPEHAILGEEEGRTAGKAQTTWYIDPIDGTLNFTRGLPFFSVSIGAAQEGRPVVGHVLDPVRNEHFRAVAGGGAWLAGTRLRVSDAADLREAALSMQTAAGADYFKKPEFFRDLHRVAQKTRKFGSIALEMSYVAAGRLDLLFAGKARPQEWWDIAAGWALVEEAGGVVTDLQGNPLTETSSHLVAGPTPAVQAFREFFEAH